MVLNVTCTYNNNNSLFLCLPIYLVIYLLDAGLVLFSFTPVSPKGCLFWCSYSWFRPVYMNLLSARGKLMLLIKTTLLPTHQHQSLDMLLVIEKGSTVWVSSPQLSLDPHYQNFSTITSKPWILLSSQSLGKAIYPHFTDQSHKRKQNLDRKKVPKSQSNP